MKMVFLHERKAQDAFAERAAEHFALNPEHWTFTDGDIAAGEYFALRFGWGGDCVVIFRIGEETPINYQNIIKADGVRHVVRPDGRPVVDDSVLRGVDASGEAPRFEDR